MEQELNLVDILKDCPLGTKLYSTIHGEVELEEIKTDNKYPIVFYYRDTSGERYLDSVTGDGRRKITYCGECTLFPSKEQRDWSKFKVEPELVDGEIYFAKTITAEWIYIYKKNYTFKTNHYVAVLNYNLTDFNNICTTYNENIILLRNAAEEEKRMFFKIIEKNGRKWDADEKKLVKIEPKFDINTLEPFDKVLVRDMDSQKWHGQLFDGLNEDTKYTFNCIIGKYHQCIPYNEETKHLRGLIKMPPEKYITWEE